MSGWGTAFRAAETGAEVERERGGDRPTREQRLAAIEKKYGRYLSEEEGKEGSLTKAYNEAVASGDAAEIAIANARWYAVQFDYARKWSKAAGKGKDPAWEQSAYGAYEDSLRELNASGATIPEDLKAAASQVAKGTEAKPKPPVDTEPPAKKVDKPEQGTPQTDESQPLSVRRQALIDEAEPWKAQAEEIDSKLALIEYIRSTGEAGGVVGAQLIASEDDLKEVRAGLSDLLETNRRSLQELGGETADVAGRSAAPTGAGHAAWQLAVSPTPQIIGRPGGLAYLVAAGLIRAREKTDAPSGVLFAPKPVGGATPEALAELKRRRDAMEKADTAREAELIAITPQIEALDDKLRRQGIQVQGGGATDVLIGKQAEDSPNAKAFRILSDRRDKLLREAQETDPAYQQVKRGISHMESVLSEQGQE